MTLQASTQAQLRQYIEQIEKLEEQKSEISQDITAAYNAAKSSGFDVKAMRAILKMRKKPKDQLDEEQAIVETYMAALGMLGDLADLPLGQSYLSAKFQEPALT